MRAILSTLRRHNAITVFLAAVFIARFFLADWNSYWSDELLSVAVYGIWDPDLITMVQHLAADSIHPPLYQIVLYIWMGIFGASEIATRSLSNLDITLAAFFLYAILTRPFGRLVAFFGAAGFSVMNWSMYYGLEARSYAQTALLVTVSSWALLRFLARLRAGESWRSGPQLAFLAVLTAANSGLMLTHYYNGFWIVAQGVFVVVVALRERDVLRWPVALGALALIGIVPVALFAAIWGRVFLVQYQERSTSFEVEGSVEVNPIQLLIGTVIRTNFGLPTLALAAVGLVIAAGIVVALVGFIRARSGVSERDWTTLYLATWLVLPLVVTYAAFVIMGVERYQARYFLFAAPPLVPLVVIGIASIIGLIVKNPERSAELTALVTTLALIVVVLPGGLDGATSRKHDWRGIIQRVVSTVEGDPSHEYVILETGFSPGQSRARFYFERYSDELRTDLVASRSSEARNDFSLLEAELPTAAEADYLVVMFLHMKTTGMPNLVTYLGDHYVEAYRQVNKDGRGFVVYHVGAPATAG